MEKVNFATLLTSIAFLAMLALSGALVAGFFGTLHPALDSFSHFRVHFAVLMALCALPLLATTFWPQAAAALVFAMAAFATTANTLPRFWAVQAYEASNNDGPVYRLLQMNLRYNNPTPEKVLSLIGRIQPDVITLDEVSDMWEAKFAPLTSAYPYRVFCPFPNGTFGVGLMSSRPFVAGTEPRCFGRGAMAIASVNLGGTPIDVAAIHLSWPWPREQYWQIGELAEPLASLGDTAIMAGDCNAVPWSAAVRRVAAISGLRLMPSVGPTWLYIKLPDFLRFAGLPIDQVFSRGAINIRSARRLEDTGSDHLPVLVEFSLRPEVEKPVDEHETATVSAEQPGKARS
ncbi:endonuclease/exonuclease/phosphatase family protein [Mesorhizobium sp. INR15]|uniref:endonuclease/exonuclease/phosphatase family protein n=1 Tax=Mesorhizobium sp. INR15 TaxID=2654248 RepID=UPI0018C06677|nr:endonuclease/exonuclease/phosphatase family protein [Mesorhizobium sp. INR15]QPC94003.1 AP endonuclease [Mesorhizobium sp. INR15]